MRRNSLLFLFLFNMLVMGLGHLQAQTLQVALSPAPKVNRTTSGGTATIFFDSNIEDLNIICTEENPNEPITKINDHQWFVNIDVNKDIESDGICYRNYLLKCSASAEYFLTTEEIAPNQVLYYTITLPNELEPKYLEEKAKSIALKANQLVDEWDSYLARLLALEALSPNFPYTPEAEYSLRKAMQNENALLKGHLSRVRYAVFSPDGKRIASASASADGTIRMWDTQTGRSLGEPFKGHTADVGSVSFSPDCKRIVSTAIDRTIRIWDVQTGHQIGKIEAPTRFLMYATFSPNGKHVAAALWDNTVRIWDVETGQQIGQPLVGHTGYVNFVSYSVDGKFLVSGSHDKTVRIWDAQTGKTVGEPLRGHEDLVKKAIFSPDGKYIVSASADNTIRVWNAKSGEQIGQPLIGSIYNFSPDGRKLLFPFEMVIEVWDLNNSQMGQVLDGTEAIVAEAMNPEGEYIVSSSADRILKRGVTEFYNKSIFQEILRGKASAPIGSASFSKDGKSVIMVNTNGTVEMWDVENANLICKIPDERTSLFNINFASLSPNGKQIVTACRDKTICMWGVETGRQIGQPFQGHTEEVCSASFSPDGKYIVSASYDKTIRIWDTETGRQIGQPLQGHTDEVCSASFSPDGKYVVSASADKTIRIWDIETGRQIGQPLQGHTDAVFSASFSPDGKYVVSASSDKTIRIWDVNEQRQIGSPFVGHTSYIFSVFFSHDNKYIVSASADKTIRIWDAKGGREVTPSVKMEEMVMLASFNKEGNRVMSVSYDGIVRVMAFPSLQQLIDETRERFKDRQLTPEEKTKYNLE